MLSCNKLQPEIEIKKFLLNGLTQFDLVNIFVGMCEE